MNHRSTNHRRSLAIAFLVAMTLLPVPATFAEGSSDQRFLAGLRERKLFELAVTYCQERLADPQLPNSRRAELTIELSLSLAEQAVNSAPDRRGRSGSRPRG